MTLRSILGGSSRVKKKKKKKKNTKSTTNKRSGAAPTTSPFSPSANWPSTLRRSKPGTSSRGSSTKGGMVARGLEEDGEEDLLPDDDDDDDDDDDNDRGPLESTGLVRALATDLRLRDVPQAMAAARARMFSPLDAGGGVPGMGSARLAELLTARARLPPLVGADHLLALLRSPPSAVERELAALARAGVVRRVVVPRRAEALVMTEDLVRLVRDAAAAAAEDKDKGVGAEAEAAAAVFLDLLRRRPAATTLPAAALAPPHADWLVRAGFLTAGSSSAATTTTGRDGAFARPEDRTTLVSLASVARAASGSLDAVGGSGGIYAAGGSGGLGLGLGLGRQGDQGGEFLIAVPGHGMLLKLVTAALGHFAALLERAPHREATETMLRERWDGGGGVVRAAKRAQGGARAVLPGRTKKWKDFHGLSFDYVLEEALGSGLVEVFETRSVGRGVRLL